MVSTSETFNKASYRLLKWPPKSTSKRTQSTPVKSTLDKYRPYKNILSISHKICTQLYIGSFYCGSYCIHGMNLPKSFRVASQALGQSCDCPSANEATLKDTSKINSFCWSIHNKVNKKHVHNNIWDVLYMIISSSKSDMDAEYTVSLVITMISRLRESIPRLFNGGRTTMTTHSAPACSQVLLVKPQGVWARSIEAWARSCDRRNLEFRRWGSLGPSNVMTIIITQVQQQILKFF